MGDFSHLDPQGKLQMVDISGKQRTSRTAEARGRIAMAPETVAALRDARVPKGDVISCAKLAAIQAAKAASSLIPLCHPVALVWVDLACEIDDRGIGLRAICKAEDATGVEMEALTAVSVAALTIYDMCKAIDKTMRIEGIEVVAKSGGRSSWGASPARS